MAKNDEISSTEKLLDVIRGKSTENPSDVIKPTRVFSDSKASRSNRKIPFKKKVSIGVDIGISDLKLAAVSLGGDKKPELFDYVSVPFDADLKKDKTRFSQFLKAAISNFCRSYKKAELWCIMSSARVETRYIRIPKVSSRQIANAVYWTYKKEVNFNDRSDIFDFEVIGDVVEEGSRKLAVIAYSASRQETQELRNLFAKIGFPLAGISIIPFAMQNFLRNQWLDIGAKNICNLFIGEDWSRIAIFAEGNLILSREIKSGIQSMIEAIRENIDQASVENSKELFGEENQPADEIPRKISEKAQDIFHRFIHESEISERNKLSGSHGEKIFDMIEIALERIVRQVERTLEHYALNFKTVPIGKVLVSGEMSSNKRIVNYIGTQLEIPVESIDPFAAGLTFSGQVVSPTSDFERGAYVPVIGIALSGSVLTPNFIHTYKDKEKIDTSARLNRTILGGVLLFVLVFAGTYHWQDHTLGIKKTQEKQFRQKLDRYIPLVDEKLILQMLAQVQDNKQSLKQYESKYEGKALMAVIAGSTPSNIRLLSFSADFGGISDQPAEDQKNENKIEKRLTLEGIIFGNRLTFESSLAGYMVQLKKSPMFGKASVKKRNMEFIDDQEVMKFTAQLDLL